MVSECRIKYFPVSFFSMILGMAGFSIAWQRVEHIFELPIHLSQYVLALTSILFFALSLTYLIKIIKYKADIAIEFNHPVKLSFFPTISISMLLLSIAYVSVSAGISKWLWVFGTLLHFAFTIKIISIWIHHTRFEIKHMNPAWFIPAVGNILVPISGVTHCAAEISWFFFSIGFFFWIILLVIFFNRIIFHHPLTEKLLPTLFILIAPPAVGFISLVSLTGEISYFANILYYIGLFLLILLVSQIKVFKRIKYYLSWWAYSFPMAAITIATILMFHKTGGVAFKYMSLVLFIILNMIILYLLVKTAYAVSKKEICIDEE
ncbi:MAG: SLAC1 anion channel family protein [Nitrospirae bacterium]|nr:SLAC1 anion channel family protein [Nitrospirota bacterium]